VTTDSQDNVIVITQGADNDEKYVIGVGKYHANGTRLWYNLWRGPSDGAYYVGARDVAVDSNDNIYVVGETEYPNWNALLMKVDPEGNQLWNRTWGNQNIAFGVQVVGTDIYVAGSHCLITNLDLWLLKYNSAGQFLWNFTCERPSVVGIPWECCLAKDHQNNLYIGGSVNQTNFDAFYMKFKATLTETETGAIPGFHFSLVWIPLVFLLLYIILRYKLPSLAEKRRI
jgi:hypothetical protein